MVRRHKDCQQPSQLENPTRTLRAVAIFLRFEWRDVHHQVADRAADVVDLLFISYTFKQPELRYLERIAQIRLAHFFDPFSEIKSH